MKKLSKPIIAIILVGILSLSSILMTFAVDSGDPVGGNSIVVPKQGFVW